jgi:hypothetical protein
MQIDASSFGTSWWGEMAWCREAFHGLRVRMSQSWILIDVLSLLVGKKRGKARGLFSKGGTCLAGC